MLEMTAAAEVDGVRFDGVDLFLFHPHVDIDSSDDDLKGLADKLPRATWCVGRWSRRCGRRPAGGSAMGNEEERADSSEQVRKGCGSPRRLRELGVRPYGVVRIDSAAGPDDWSKDPEGNQKKIADTFREAGDVAEDYGERLAAEGEICWGGMHSWRRMVQLLEMVDRPETVGFQADMAHTLLYTMGYNAPDDRCCRENYDWQDKSKLDEALRS